MANTILPQSSYLGSAAGNLLGTGGSNTSTAAQGVFNVGQFQPYSINNPLGQTSFSGGQANTTMSPLQTQLSGLFGNQISNNLSGPSAGYDPNTSFLPQQYQSIFGNMQGNANSMFNNLQQAQKPFTDQYLQSNLDNEFSKGTLASTAGAYQTAGAQTAANSQMNQNQATAQQFALQNAQAQFGAANSTAQLGEQQSQFAPQFAQQQTQGLYSNLLNNASLLNQQTSLGGSLGALQSNANTTAAYPSFQAAQQQDQAQSGLMNGLLFGNGSGGLLGSLFGTSGGAANAGGGVLSNLGGSAGNFLSGLINGNSTVNGNTVGGGLNDGLFGGNTGQATNPFTGASTNGNTSGGFDTQDAANIENGSYGQQQQITDPDLSMSNSDLASLWGDDGNGGLFNSAGGQATNLNQATQLNNSDLAHLYGSPSKIPQGFSPSISNVLGAGASGLSLANALGAGNGVGAAGSLAGLASNLGAPSSITSPVSTGASLAGLGMNIASGNLLGALSGAVGLGGKAGIPNYITQPLALALSAAMGNPFGIAMGAAKVGKGLMNLISTGNYGGLQGISDSLTKSAQSDLNSSLDAAIGTDTSSASQIPGLNAQQIEQYTMAGQNAGSSLSSFVMGEDGGLPGLQTAGTGNNTSSPQAIEAAYQQIMTDIYRQSQSQPNNSNA